MPVDAVDIRTSLARRVLVHVAFTPGEETPAPVGIVVDVRRVLCCAEIEEARTLAQTEGPAKLAGERRLEAIPGFDFGNSPREVAGEPAAETLILSTTNGTRLLVSAAERFEHVYVGSLLNLDAVAAAARAHEQDVAVLCAGVLGELALDDAYCAGRIAWNLRRHGLEADIDWCARENALDVVPRYGGAVGPAAAVGL